LNRKNYDKEPPLSLSQQAYVLASSLREIINSLAIFCVILIAYFVLGILSENPLAALLIVLILFAPFLAFMLIRSRRFYKELNTWKEQYLQNSYTLIFDTTIPQGSFTGERIMSLARLIFPQLRTDYFNYYYVFNFVRFLLKKAFAKPWDTTFQASQNYRIDENYSVDVALNTLEGYFIVKDFKDHVVTMNDLEYLLKIARHKFRNRRLQPNIFRIIVVAKNYEESFLNRESLEQIMKRLASTKLRVDLIMEEEKGYSVLWIT
jgi:hypothetical protein